MKQFSIGTLLLVFLVAGSSCKDKSIVGRWKVDHLTYINGKYRDSIEINNSDMLRKILTKGWGSKYNSQQIDSIVYRIQHSYITLNADNTFQIDDVGSIIRDPDGFFFKGIDKGRWELLPREILKLDFSASGNRRYRILEQREGSITLNELFEETESPTAEVQLIRQ